MVVNFPIQFERQHYCKYMFFFSLKKQIFFSFLLILV